MAASFEDFITYMKLVEIIPYRFRFIPIVVLLGDDKLVELLKGFEIFFLKALRS